MPLPPLPTRIAVGVRVQETKKNGRTGTVVSSVGLRKWEIRFDGDEAVEIKASAGALKICRNAYGTQSSPNKPSTSVTQAAPKTGRNKTRRGRGNTDTEAVGDEDSSLSSKGSSIVSNAGMSSINDGSGSNEDSSLATGSGNGSDSSIETSSSSEAFGSGSSSESSSKKNTFSSEPKRKGRKGSILLSAKRYLKGRGKKKKGRSSRLTQTRLEKLYTPRPLSESDSSEEDASNVESFSTSTGSNDGVFIPAEGEGFDDAREDSEDDDGRGDPKVCQNMDGEGTRVEFIDCPQKDKLYQAAKKKMEEEKEDLIMNKRTFTVEVKAKQKYEFGGRVEGRAKAPTYAGSCGTIIDILEGTDSRYTIQW